MIFTMRFAVDFVTKQANQRVQSHWKAMAPDAISAFHASQPHPMPPLAVPSVEPIPAAYALESELRGLVAEVHPPPPPAPIPCHSSYLSHQHATVPPRPRIEHCMGRGNGTLPCTIPRGLRAGAHNRRRGWQRGLCTRTQVALRTHDTSPMSTRRHSFFVGVSTRHQARRPCWTHFQGVLQSHSLFLIVDALG